MLSSLAIQNVVLIDRLTLEAEDGLSALTGETGAGKSILLDALGLALGARADAGLVRHGEQQASVTAGFDVPPSHPVFAALDEKGIHAADTLILRRTLGKDGRSKAFINDAPVSVQLLKDVGAMLVEVHGQFDTQGLLDAETHLRVLDQYAGTTADAADVRAAWDGWARARANLDQANADVDAAKLQEDYLRYAVAELEKLAPQKGEETTLAEKRAMLMNREKMNDAVSQASELLESEEGIQSLLGRLELTLERLSARIGGDALAAVTTAASRARAEVDELAFQVERLQDGGAFGDDRLEDVEERYFALRECAKKHRCTVDDLPDILADMAQKLRLVTDRDDALADLHRAVKLARDAFMTRAEKLAARRKKAAQKLAKAVNAELPALKLDKAQFFVDCAPAAESDWGPRGMDVVRFTVSTNPQAPAGALNKIASGGELSRFMLALRLILAECGAVPTLVFDEVDSGIGGATADAVGERLARLSRNCQVLVVTHSPQVAARAAHHWIVAKTEQKGAVLTRITPLSALSDRQEEIARMISGATVTAEARAAARKLLENHAA